MGRGNKKAPQASKKAGASSASASASASATAASNNKAAERRRKGAKAAAFLSGDGLERELAVVGLRVVKIVGDGNCLFRAVGDQVYVSACSSGKGF